MAMTDPSPIPPHAVTMWATATEIIVALPATPVPYLTRFALSEGGLNKALNLLKIRRDSVIPTKAKADFTKPHPLVHRGKRPKPDPFSPEQRQRAHEILSRLGAK